MHLPHKLQPYLPYMKLSDKERKKRIEKAQQDDLPSSNPQKNYQFP